jgi:hypothetical protein
MIVLICLPATRHRQNWEWNSATVQERFVATSGIDVSASKSIKTRMQDENDFLVSFCPIADFQIAVVPMVDSHSMRNDVRADPLERPHEDLAPSSVLMKIRSCSISASSCDSRHE